MENGTQSSFMQSLAEELKQDLDLQGQQPSADEPEVPLLTVDEVDKHLQLELGLNPNGNEPPSNSDPKPTDNQGSGEDKPWYLQTDSATAEPAKETVDEWKQRYSQLEQTFNSIKEDEIIKLHLELKDAPGYDFQELVKSLAPEKEVDSSLEDLYKAYLEKSGASEDIIAEELEKLDNRTFIEKDELHARLKEVMKPASNGVNPYVERIRNAKTAREQEILVEQERLEKAWNGANEFMNSIEGKSIGGFTLDKQTVETLRGSFSDANYYRNSDGSYNHQKQVMERMWGMYGPKIVDSLIKQARAQWVNERANPSSESQRQGLPPLDGREKASRDADDYFNRNK